MGTRGGVVAWVALAVTACGAKVDGSGVSSHHDGANGGSGAASGGSPGSGGTMSAATGGSVSATGGTSSDVVCAKACEVAMGTPLDASRGCFDDAKQTVIGCDCADPNSDGFTGETCGRRLADGTEWFAPSSAFDDTAVWGPCTATPQTYHSCRFAHCAVPPPSLCDLASTCHTLHCGSVEFDADGCARPSCTTDTDCPETDRCVSVGCSASASCSPVKEGCVCSSLALCRPGHVCNSTKVYGARGEWLEFYMNVLPGPCRYGTDCGDTYALMSDGSATVTRADTVMPATVLPEQFQELTLLFDGPLVRPTLRDGADCGPVSSDTEVRMSLRTTTETLSREVTACALNPDGVLNAVYRLLKGL